MNWSDWFIRIEFSLLFFFLLPLTLINPSYSCAKSYASIRGVCWSTVKCTNGHSEYVQCLRIYYILSFELDRFWANDTVRYLWTLDTLRDMRYSKIVICASIVNVKNNRKISRISFFSSLLTIQTRWPAQAIS